MGERWGAPRSAGLQTRNEQPSSSSPHVDQLYGRETGLRTQVSEVALRGCSAECPRVRPRPGPTRRLRRRRRGRPVGEGLLAAGAFRRPRQRALRSGRGGFAPLAIPARDWSMSSGAWSLIRGRVGRGTVCSVGDWPGRLRRLRSAARSIPGPSSWRPTTDDMRPGSPTPPTRGPCSSTVL